jgi:hypothetical protein
VPLLEHEYVLCLLRGLEEQPDSALNDWGLRLQQTSILVIGFRLRKGIRRPHQKVLESGQMKGKAIPIGLNSVLPILNEDMSWIEMTLGCIAAYPHVQNLAQTVIVYRCSRQAHQSMLDLGS